MATIEGTPCFGASCRVKGYNGVTAAIGKFACLHAIANSAFTDTICIFVKLNMSPNCAGTKQEVEELERLFIHDLWVPEFAAGNNLTYLYHACTKYKYICCHPQIQEMLHPFHHRLRVQLKVTLHKMVWVRHCMCKCYMYNSLIFRDNIASGTGFEKMEVQENKEKMQGHIADGSTKRSCLK